jgi:hypothetical protein
VGGGARRRRTLKYHYSGRYLAHLIGWRRGPLGPHILAPTCVRKRGRAASGPLAVLCAGRPVCLLLVGRRAWPDAEAGGGITGGTTAPAPLPHGSRLKT